MDDFFGKITPIEHSDKIEQVLSALQSFIIDGNLNPGTELPAERDLAAKLNVSRFSLREALRAAQAQGLIEIKRGKKPTVSAPSPSAAAEVLGLTLRRSKKPLIDLIIARESLEIQIVKLAVQNASPEHIEALEKTLTAMEENKDDLALCAKKDVEFHNILLEASDNIVFAVMLAPVSQLLKKSRIATLKFRGIDRAIQGHRAVLKAINNGDSEAAAEAMSQHLEMAEDDLKNIEKNQKS